MYPLGDRATFMLRKLQQFPMTGTSGVELPRLEAVDAGTWGTVARTAGCEGVHQGMRAESNWVSRARIRQKHANGADCEPSS
jgi:hypothetical protein